MIVLTTDFVQMTTNARIVPASLRDVIVTQIRQTLMSFVLRIKSASNVNALKKVATVLMTDSVPVATNARIVPASLKDVIVIQTHQIQMNFVQQTKNASNASVWTRAATALMTGFVQVTTNARIVRVFLKVVIVTQILTIQMNFVKQTKNVISANA